VHHQKDVCDKYSAEYAPPKLDHKLGIALETIGKLPVNGVRHTEENGTCGWYIWCGEEMGQDSDFFKPLHVSHIAEYLPEIERFLALPSGYRVLIANEYEDVWYDESISSM